MCFMTAIVNLCCRNIINDGNQNNLKTIEAKIVLKLKINEPKLKFNCSYKKKSTCNRVNTVNFSAP